MPKEPFNPTNVIEIFNHFFKVVVKGPPKQPKEPKPDKQGKKG